MLSRATITDMKDKMLSAALKAVKAGEKAALRSFTYNKTNGFSLKSPGQIVTLADLQSNLAVQKVLAKETPDIPVVSEEGGTLEAKNISQVHLAWALDPIDGTTNFAARIPLWGISLGLLAYGEPIVGVISLPSLKQVYRAVKGKGSWMGNHRLKVSKTKNLKDSMALLCYDGTMDDIQRGLSTVSALGTRVRSERILGASVIESLWIAAGRADFSISHNVKIWDVAAGVLMVREAGGKVTTPQGKSWKCGDPDIVLSNPYILPAIIKALKQ